MNDNLKITEELKNEFGGMKITGQPTRDDVPTVWADKENAGGILRYLEIRGKRAV